MAIWLLRATLALIGLILPLLGLELALRFIGPIVPGNYETALWRTGHPVFGTFHVPGADAWIRDPEFTVRLRINSHGLRGPDLSYEKPPNTLRILTVGDSFVEARQVQEEESLTVKLQTLLSAPGQPVQVVNAGFTGWGPAEEYLFLQHEGLHYQPDLVILSFYIGNDVTNNYSRSERELRSLHEPGFSVGPGGELQALPWTLKQRGGTDTITDALRERSVLFRVFESGVLDKFRNELATAEPVVNPRRLAIYRTRETPQLAEAWRTTDALLGAIQDRVNQSGARVLLLVVPSKWQVHGEDWQTFLAYNGVENDGWDLERPNKRLAQIAARRGLPMIDLLPALRAAAERGQRLYYPVDIHFTAAGHAVAAQTVRDFLAATPFLPTELAVR